MKNTQWLKMATAISLMVLLTACAGPDTVTFVASKAELEGLLAVCTGQNTVMYVASQAENVVGFWSGLIHGIIAPFTLIVSLFSNNITMYQVHNNGGWYDFGFILGVVILFWVTALKLKR